MDLDQQPSLESQVALLPPGIMRQGRLIVEASWDGEADAPPAIGAERAFAPGAD